MVLSTVCREIHACSINGLIMVYRTTGNFDERKIDELSVTSIFNLSNPY